MGMLLHRHYAENEPEPVKQPVQADEKESKAEAVTAKKPGRPKKSQ